MDYVFEGYHTTGIIWEPIVCFLSNSFSNAYMKINNMDTKAAVGTEWTSVYYGWKVDFKRQICAEVALLNNSNSSVF